MCCRVMLTRPNTIIRFVIRRPVTEINNFEKFAKKNFIKILQNLEMDYSKTKKSTSKQLLHVVE